MAYDSLKALIRQYIKTNGEQEITGQILQNVLVEMVNQYPSTDGYATQSWVTSQGYLIPGSSISLLGNDVGYLTSADLSGYATTSQLAGYLPLTGGTMAGDLNMAAYKLYFGTPYIYESTIPGPHGTNMGHILQFAGVDGYGYYGFDNSVHATSFIKSGGTSAQFLKADGSVDSNTYITASALTGYATQSWVTTQLGSYNPTANFKTINNQSIIGTGNINIEGGGGTLYDAEVEYLESSGYETIYTGVEMEQGVTHRFEIGLYIISASGASRYIISAHNPNTNVIAIQVYTNSGHLYTQNYPISNVNTGATSEMVATVSGMTNTLSYQGRNISTTYGGVSGEEKIYLLYNPEISAFKGALVRISYCKIYKGTTLVRDFIPVRVGQVGYLYDKVSGQLFGNEGTGDFVLGQDTGPGGGLPYLPLTGGNITGNLTVNGSVKFNNNLTFAYDRGINFGTDNSVRIMRNGYRLLIVNEASDDIIIGDYNNSNSTSIVNDLQGCTANSAYIVGSPTWFIRNDGTAQFRSVSQTSDLRKKTIMGDVPMNLYNVANAPLFKFTWNDEKEYSGQHIGSAAQYWQTVLPELVSIGRDTEQTLAMQYDVIALASAITVAKTVVNHEERIILLERENEALKKEIADLKSA